MSLKYKESFNDFKNHLEWFYETSFSEILKLDFNRDLKISEVLRIAEFQKSGDLK